MTTPLPPPPPPPKPPASKVPPDLAIGFAVGAELGRYTKASGLLAVIAKAASIAVGGDATLDGIAAGALTAMAHQIAAKIPPEPVVEEARKALALTEGQTAAEGQAAKKATRRRKRRRARTVP